MENSEIKIIFVDIDWTILDHKNNHKFDIESLLALQEAQKKGIKVFYCTARPLYSLDQIGALDILKPDGFVTANGGVVMIDDKIIHSEPIPKDIYERCCEVANKYGYNMLCAETKDCFLLKEKDKYIDEYFKVYYEPLPKVSDYKNKEVISIILFTTSDMDETFKNEFPKDIVYFRYHDCAVEVVDKEHYKGTGVKKTLEYYGYTKDNAMSIGDDYGDISMFDETSISVAVGNAKEEVKQAAKYVTKEVSENGVKEALIHYKII